MKNNFKAKSKAKERTGAFTESLSRQYTGRINSISLRMLGDVHTAEEATTAVFVRLARALGRAV